ncbi:hypothetical protein [Sulfolobus spindle-shaped virus]|nr:hypothetical protein [Sulfolobus spindle-shaped virus]
MKAYVCKECGYKSYDEDEVIIHLFKQHSYVWINDVNGLIVRDEVTRP